MQRSLRRLMEMMQQQQQQITHLHTELSRQRAVAGDVSQLSMQIDSVSASVTDRVTALLQEQHQLDGILHQPP